MYGFCWHNRERTQFWGNFLLNASCRESMKHVNSRYVVLQIFGAQTSTVWFCCDGKKPWNSFVLRKVYYSCLQLYRDTKKLVTASGSVGKGCIEQWWGLQHWQCSKCLLNRLFPYIYNNVVIAVQIRLRIKKQY